MSVLKNQPVVPSVKRKCVACERPGDPHSPGRVVTGLNRPAGRHLLSANITTRGALISRGLVSYTRPPEG